MITMTPVWTHQLCGHITLYVFLFLCSDTIQTSGYRTNKFLGTKKEKGEESRKRAISFSVTNKIDESEKRIFNFEFD